MAGKFCLWTFLLILSSTLLNFSASLPVRRESHNKCTEPDEIRDYAFVLKMMKMMMNNKDQELKNTSYNSTVCPMFRYYSYFQTMLEVLTADDTSSGASGDNTTSDTSGDVLTVNTTSDVSGDTATNTALPYDIERPSNIRALNFLIKKLIISSCEYVKSSECNGTSCSNISCSLDSIAVTCLSFTDFTDVQTKPGKCGCIKELPLEDDLQMDSGLSNTDKQSVQTLIVNFIENDLCTA